ncbi:hypothetical protein PG984_014296 [Apiospora sp. TS-2023a]
MDSVYKRAPLNVSKTIRLLVPQHRTLEGQLSYKFTVESLESNARYAALSYVWGTPNTTRPNRIMLDGVLCKVTPNLLSALEMVEKAMVKDTHTTATPPPLIWADQLCINQADNTEKSKQVALMGELYARAQTVYICLGAPETAQEAVHLITEVSQRIDQDKAHYGGIQHIPNPDVSDLDWECYNRLNWDAFRTMLQQVWFSRVWVVQEAGLARHAVALYGNCSFEWSSLMLVLTWLSESGYKLRRFHNIPGWTTHQLHAAYQFQATNPRDYIFAFLGHPSANLPSATNARAPLIVPDYVAPVTSVFIQFARKWLEISRTPHMLSCVNHKSLPSTHLGNVGDGHRQLDSPSWCPRWTHLPLGGSRFVDESSNHAYSAASSTEFQFQILPNDHLVVRGFSYDVVIETFASLDELPDPLRDVRIEDSKFSTHDLSNLTKLAFLCCKALDAAEESSSGSELSMKDILHHFAATATASTSNRDRDQLLANFKASVLAAQQVSRNMPEAVPDQYKDALDRLADYFQLIDLIEPDNYLVRFMASIEDSLFQRRLFLCRTGVVGLGPPVVEKGDQCCIIAGGQVPYVLRPFGDTGYFFVGECYINGIMDGEAVEGRERSGLEWCDFELV